MQRHVIGKEVIKHILKKMYDEPRQKPKPPTEKEHLCNVNIFLVNKYYFNNVFTLIMYYVIIYIYLFMSGYVRYTFLNF